MDAADRSWRQLVVSNVSKTYRDTRGGLYTALRNVSLTIERGDFYCLLGPSGCGKSTLLNMVAGFEECTEGRIGFAGEDQSRSWLPITGPGADRTVIFQDASAALFPWLNVEENIALGPKLAKRNRDEYQDKLVEYTNMVGLSRHAHKFPFELSGGMRQRVQIARALIMEPDILLMDEPFAALDAITKRLLQQELARIWRETGKTIVYITHDIVEALLLGTHVAVMSSGPAATIKREVRVELSSPRTYTNADFIELLKELESLLLAEVSAGAANDEATQL
jgi:NitT/TauT family transport system ATP-binding protein